MEVWPHNEVRRWVGTFREEGIPMQHSEINSVVNLGDFWVKLGCRIAWDTLYDLPGGSSYCHGLGVFVPRVIPVWLTKGLFEYFDHSFEVIEYSRKVTMIQLFGRWRYSAGQAASKTIGASLELREEVVADFLNRRLVNCFKQL